MRGMLVVILADESQWLADYLGEACKLVHDATAMVLCMLTG